MLEVELSAAPLLAAVGADADIIADLTESRCFWISLEVLVVFVKVGALRAHNVKFFWTRICPVSLELGIVSLPNGEMYITRVL